VNRRFFPLTADELGHDFRNAEGGAAGRRPRLRLEPILHGGGHERGDAVAARAGHLGEEPLLADLYAASVHGRVATGPRAGQRLRRVGDRIDADALPQLEASAARVFPA
jgi:hypothetical protein